jgi:putative chitinase
MNAISRKPIFDAAKRLGAVIKTTAHVKVLDDAIDEAFTGVPAEIIVTAPAKSGLNAAAAFFAHMRGTRILGPDLTQSEVDGCVAILDACGAAGWGAGWTAYALATAYHETAGTMQPIKEYGRGKGRKYGTPGKHGQIAYGRGYVQLTWDYNYEKADKKLGLGGALTRDYELALKQDIAAQIMTRGMEEGWFTGKRLGDFLPRDGTGKLENFIACRPIINGRDKDRLIAGYAVEFQKAVIAGEWK